MSEKSSARKKKVVGAGEEVEESFLAPMTKKKKKESKMHRCEVCGKKFPRLRTHMNMHERCCTRTFGVRSNAKRHLRTDCVQHQQQPITAQQTTSSVLPTHDPSSLRNIIVEHQNFTASSHGPLLISFLSFTSCG
ncbi:hypothetical protein BYT27DRAFT_7274955 [Phlegmacium glaucopus]|nr:hypothetical protein BYT27DRAFT_7274955 [Phlegmacium glaucopus]